ncbi:PIN/TRAM domain-containing protein [Desulfofalx alkaliphila]|uniref:PIN/TRAM domain-containing protein n=1 Tax=Desulfofalx alkaliphila TaxID=105483 RepID=UPI0004E12738|nr:PIN/TRAM domain-containing protein [Desulfofalx alkaliphila]
MVRKTVYCLLICLFAAVGFYASLNIIDRNIITIPEHLPQVKIGLIIVISLVGALAGVLLAPWIIKVALWFAAYVDQYLAKTPTSDLVMGTVGLIFGLIIANLLGSILSFMGTIGKAIWLLSTILLGYLGLTVGIKKREELVGLVSSFPRFVKDKTSKVETKGGAIKVLDTSVIIDGRIADLCESGFLEGTMLVPNFVVDELRHIADSADVLKRNRGRRGLDILNHMRKNMPDVKVQVYDDLSGLEDIPEVDAKLVKLAEKLGAKILTNDFNLNKVAELHGVKVLNINELANAVKPVVLPGEEMVVQVVKDGKEMGQGLAYLEDGTMIVVDGGKRFMGQTITVLVTSVLQTAAGRMIFAKPKSNDRRGESAQHYSDGVNALG